MPRRLRGLAAGFVLLALSALGALSLLTPSRATATNTTLSFTGYQSQGAPVTLIASDAPALTEVGVDGIGLDGTGAGVTPVSAAALGQLAAARAVDRPATLLVSNWDNTTNAFSETLALRLLDHPAAIAQVCAQLRADVQNEHWQGITLDFETLTGADAGAFARFVATLRRRLPADAGLSIDVSNNTSLSDYVANGYDLRALARSADEIVLMAYDEHGDWESQPGPVGALGWQRQGIRTILQAVPRGKLTLGVAGYGYRWSPHLRAQVSDAQARALASTAGAVSRFDTAAGEWTARLPDGTVLWWADGRSLALRDDLARRLGLRGLALWSLGLADPLGPLPGVGVAFARAGHAR